MIPAWALKLTIALGLAALVVLWHFGQIDAAEKRGADAAYARVQDKAFELQRKATELNRKVFLHVTTEQRRADDFARSLSLRGPGAARSPSCAAASGGHVAASGPGPAAVDRLPDPVGIDLISVPFADLVEVGRTCRANQLEVMGWRAANPAPAAASAAKESSDLPR